MTDWRVRGAVGVPRCVLGYSCGAAGSGRTSLAAHVAFMSQAGAQAVERPPSLEVAFAVAVATWRRRREDAVRGVMRMLTLVRHEHEARTRRGE